MRLFERSATKMRPRLSQQIPHGRDNCPSKIPSQPNEYNKLPKRIIAAYSRLAEIDTLFCTSGGGEENDGDQID